MFAWIDAIPWWVDVVVLGAFVLGCLSGRRWERVKQDAVCTARLCPQILKVRAENVSLNRQFDFMRGLLRDKDEKIHKLKTSNGIMGREIEKLTHQLPRPVRRMVA